MELSISVLRNMEQCNKTNVSCLPITTLVCSWINIVVLITPALAINIIALIVTIFEFQISRPIRISLINILVGCLIVGLSGATKYLSSLLIGYIGLETSDLFCRFFSWFYLMGQASRLSFMTMLAIVVNILVRYGEVAKGRKALVILLVTVAVVWLVVASYSLVPFSSQIIKVDYIEDIMCSPRLQQTLPGYISAAIYFIAFGLLSYILTIAIAISGVLFVKRNTVSDDSGPKKALTNFTFFLLIGNTIGLIGQTIPLIIGSLKLDKDLRSEIIAQYTQSVFTYLSIYPTPLLIMLYFKPLRMKILRCMPCNWPCFQHEKQPDKKLHTVTSKYGSFRQNTTNTSEL